MKKYTLALVVFAFIIGLFVTNVETASAYTYECAPGHLFSIVTGKPCGNTSQNYSFSRNYNNVSENRNINFGNSGLQSNFCDGAGIKISVCEQDQAILNQFISANSAYGLTRDDLDVRYSDYRIIFVSAINKGTKIRALSNILSLKALDTLNLPGNFLTGSIPNIPNYLRVLNLSSNKLTGGYSNIGNTSLTISNCDVSFNYLNQFSGPRNCNWQPQKVSAPSVASLSPVSGLAGSTFIINGYNLGDFGTIHFGSLTYPYTCNGGYCLSVPYTIPSGTIAGSYGVYITNSFGMSNSISFTVIPPAVTPPPTPPPAQECILNANFTTNPISGFGPAPLSVAFTDSSTSVNCSGPSSYFWSFGDGQTSTERNPNHIYSNVGSYNVTLIVNIGNVRSTKNFTIITTSVTPPPPTQCRLSAVASATGSTTGTAPLPVSFTGAFVSNCYGDYSYLWNFGDGQTSNSQNPNHTYNQAGTYNTVLTVNLVTANQGTLTAVSRNITITVNPAYVQAPSITYLSPANGWVGSNFTINGLNLGNTSNAVIHFGSIDIKRFSSYRSFDGSTILATYVPDVEPGTYLVSVTNQNGTSNSVDFGVMYSGR